MQSRGWGPGLPAPHRRVLRNCWWQHHWLQVSQPQWYEVLHSGPRQWQVQQELCTELQRGLVVQCVTIKMITNIRRFIFNLISVASLPILMACTTLTQRLHQILSVASIGMTGIKKPNIPSRGAPWWSRARGSNTIIFTVHFVCLAVFYSSISFNRVGIETVFIGKVTNRAVYRKWRSFQNGAKHLLHKMAQASCCSRLVIFGW